MLNLQLFATKYAQGGEPAVAVLPVLDALRTEWPTDVHFCCYLSDPPQRIRKDLKFKATWSIWAYDLDPVGPGVVDKKEVLKALKEIKAPMRPHFFYWSTRGARLLWLGPTITSGLIYEGIWTWLLNRVIRLGLCGKTFVLDRACKDYTRFFRAPNVVRSYEDHEQPISSQVYEMNDAPRQFAEAQRVAERKIALFRPWRPTLNRYGPTDARHCRQYLDFMTREVSFGERNAALFKTAASVLHYQDGDGLLDAIRERALSLGLVEREVEQTLRSAERTVRRKE